MQFCFIMLDVYINLFFISIIILLFIIKYQTITIEQKVLGILFMITLPFELYGGYLQSFKLNNLFIYHVLVPVQYAIYSLIYYLRIDSGSIKKIILLSVFLVAAAALVLALTIQPLHSYNSYVIVLSNFLIVMWILLYYRQLFIQLKIIKLEREPLFWISTGLLFYAFGSFFVEGLMKELIDYSLALASKYYYNILIVLVSFLYVMFIVSFLCRDVFRNYDKAL